MHLFDCNIPLYILLYILSKSRITLKWGGFVGDFSITHDFSSNEIYYRPMQLCVKAWKRVRSSAECTLVEPTCN